MTWGWFRPEQSAENSSVSERVVSTPSPFLAVSSPLYAAEGAGDRDGAGASTEVPSHRRRVPIAHARRG